MNALKNEEDREEREYPRLQQGPSSDRDCTAYVLGCMLREEWRIIGKPLPNDCRDYWDHFDLLEQLITEAQEGGRQFCGRTPEVRHDCRCYRLVTRMKDRFLEVVEEVICGIPTEWERELARNARRSGTACGEDVAEV